MSGKGKPEDFLIPSVVVTSVMEIYNNQDYKQVIKLCDLVLNDVHNYFPDQERELRYWLCLALARTTNKQRFFEEVQHFRGTDYFFLEDSIIGMLWNILKQKNASTKRLKSLQIFNVLREKRLRLC